MSLVKERPLRGWLKKQLGSHGSGSPVTLKDIYTKLTPFERQMLMRMLRERRITVMDIAFVEVRDVLEDIQKVCFTHFIGEKCPKKCVKSVYSPLFHGSFEGD